MEFRAGRYHSGVDLRTQGREGLRVVAPAAGSVVRLRTSPHGYGIAVYLRLADGRQIVLAHLSALADRLRAPLLAAWSASARYEQDLQLGANAIPVEAGELLALSGATGVGAPHLHLELRDAAQRPLNPLTHGFSLPDSVAPRIVAVRLVPLSREARVEGERRPRVLAPGESAAVAGSLGVMVAVDDRSGFAPFRLGPAELRIRLNGREIYRLRNESFAFSQTGQMRLERAEDPLDPRRSWLRLYRRPGNQLPGRTAEGPQGMSFAIAAGEEAMLELSARDAAGNVGSAEFRLRGEGIARADSAGSRAWVPYAEENAGTLPPPGGRIEGGAGGSRRLPAALDRQDSLWVFDPDGRALYPGGAAWLEATADRLPKPRGMRPVGAGCTLRTAGAVFREGLGVSVRAPGAAHPTQYALFRVDSRHRWRFVAGPLDSTGILRGTVDGPGRLVLCRDRSAPRIGSFVARNRPLRLRARLAALSAVERRNVEGLTLPRWPAVSVPVVDEGAGIEDAGPVALLDGKPYPARWDPEGERLVFEFWIDPGAGDHRLTVQAQDRVGNSSRREIRLHFGS
jgi:hypothetical protein